MVFEEDFCGGSRFGGFIEWVVEFRMFVFNRSFWFVFVFGFRDELLY